MYGPATPAALAIGARSSSASETSSVRTHHPHGVLDVRDARHLGRNTSCHLHRAVNQEVRLALLKDAGKVIQHRRHADPRKHSPKPVPNPLRRRDGAEAGVGLEVAGQRIGVV